MITPTLLLGLSAAICEPAPQDWPHWRGPNYDGSTNVTGLPTDFDREKGVRWATPLPGPGASTPIVIGEHIFLTAADEELGELLALCVDRASGEVLWTQMAGSGYRPGGKGSATRLHNRSNYATPSAACDGERVVFIFGNGDLVAYDLEGEELWRRNLQQDFGDFTLQWTFGTTPTLWKGRLHFQILQRDKPVHGLGKEGNPSFLLALDPKTGETLYQLERPSPARHESLEAFATPIPFVGEDGREELLIVGGDVITGHDPATGKEFWRWGTWNEGHREEWWRVVPSPVVGAGTVLVCAPKNAPIFAVKLGGEGTLGEEGLLWKSAGRRDPLTSDVPTPLFYRGSFYVLSDLRSALSRVDPASGEVAWTLSMPGRERWRGSPTGADGKIWCINHQGLVVVVDAESGEIVHQAAMGEEDSDFVRSTVVAAHGALFVRTDTTLFCIAR